MLGDRKLMIESVIDRQYGEEFDPKWAGQSLQKADRRRPNKKDFVITRSSIWTAFTGLCSYLFTALLAEHLRAFEKMRALWTEHFYWNEQISVR